jgi:hypothetical protein
VSAGLPSQGTKLVWSLRRHAWLVVACVLLVAGASLLIAPATPVYQGQALVVAQQLTMKSEALPALAESVFEDGTVATAVAADPAVGGDRSGLIPNRVSVVAAKDSIVIAVQGRDPDPATAARLANTAATAYVDALNRGGAGVGQFSLQTPAPVPTAPMEKLSVPMRAAIGALAGLILGLGLVALLAALTSPVVTARDVEQTVDVPVLGTVQLPPMKRGEYPGPLGVPGIATVTRWLATVPSGRLLLISPPSAIAVRQRVFVMVAVALWTLRTVWFEACQELVQAVDRHCLDHRNAGRAVHARQAGSDELVLADGGSPLEIADPATTNVSVVAVVPHGLSRRRLRTLASDYEDGGLVGVILVDVRPGWRLGLRRGRGAAASASLPAAQRGTARSVPEPERA